MNATKPTLFLGLGKVLFNSNLCRLKVTEKGPLLEVFLLERLSRKKADGSWPEALIDYSGAREEVASAIMAENRDVKTPLEREEELNSVIPFFDYLKKNKLAEFSSFYNPNLKFISHHLAHASLAKFMSPFDEAAILVIDGAGSHSKDVHELKGPSEVHEEASIYHLKDGELKIIKKDWQSFSEHGKHWYSEGIGSCYEKVAEYIFKSKRAAGKVMGLAAFGTAKEYKDSMELLKSLDWEKSYKGTSKQDWEESKNLNLYKDLAASVQRLFELELEKKCHEIKKLMPLVENLIIIGGCALNCVSNQKILDQKIFKSLYAPANPGDEGIGMGCALHEYYQHYNWKKFSFESQHGYFGPLKSIPMDEEIEKVFSNFTLVRHSDINEVASDLLVKGETLAWFQGRSESGPRALGNRSILSKVNQKGLKDYLNKEVKFRESFRPYGSSVLEDYAAEYFYMDEGFSNPYMSFAVKIKEDFKDDFSEVCHVDGTSRIQTVSNGQNPRYYDLIKKVGEKSGLYALLNTSLNIMGEPIIETLNDAKHFLENSNLNYLVVGDYLVSKEGVL